MKKLLFCLHVLFVISGIHAQVIWENDIIGTNPSTDNPYTTGQTYDPNVTVSGIGRGSGIAANAGQNRYNAKGWTSSSSLDPNDYFEFTITPISPNVINFSQFIFELQTSQNDAPGTFELRYSINGSSFSLIGSATSIALNSNVTYTYSLTASAFQNVSSAIKFRIYAYNAATGGLGTLSVNNFVFNGNMANPVSFGSIHATQSNGRLNIQWATLTENNNDHFDIEVSKDGNKFTKIATVKSKALAGTSEISQSYEYQISVNQIAGFMSLPFILGLLSFAIVRRRKILAGVMVIFLIGAAISCTKGDVSMSTSAKSVYVRIAQVDIDGKKSYSKVIQAGTE